MQDFPKHPPKSSSNLNFRVYSNENPVKLRKEWGNDHLPPPMSIDVWKQRWEYAGKSHGIMEALLHRSEHLSTRELRITMAILYWYDFRRKRKKKPERLNNRIIRSITGMDAPAISRTIRVLGGSNILVNLYTKGSPNWAINPDPATWMMTRIPHLRNHYFGRKKVTLLRKNSS